jgi:hypothetical protein
MLAGSGKTFTMTGNAEMPGLTPRAVTELYSTIGDMTDSTVVVKSYFVELYNDQVVDLYAKLAHQKEPGYDPPRLDIKVRA